MELNKNFDATYEPKSLNDIAFNYAKDRSKLGDIVTGRSGFPGSGRNGILLVGDTGSGKSTLAKLLPNWIEQARGGVEATPSYHQIGAEKDNGVQLIILVRNIASLVPLQQQFNYIVLDEVDLLSWQAMADLKSCMNVAFGSSVFILTTNNIEKVDNAVVDRCHVFYLDHAPNSAWLPLYKRILSDHGITNVTEKTMLDNIDMCNGSGRNVIDSAKQVILDYNESSHTKSMQFSANVV